MKLWHSFVKELKLSSRGFYFYVEIFMALIILAVVLFVVPEEFKSKKTEYIYMDLPTELYNKLMEDGLEDDIDGKAEIVNLKVGKEVYKTIFYETDEKKKYVFESREEVEKITKTKKNALGAILSLDDNGRMHYEYILQGYESERLKNLYLVVHNREMDELESYVDNQEVQKLTKGYVALSDRENVLPSLLTFNGSLMGIFIIAAYIFLDKQEGVIKAYAVTPSTVREYLLSKIGVILVVSIISTIIIVVPIMKLKANYLLLFLLLLTSGFFASVLGLFLASFYKNLTNAFGALYIVMMIMLLPNIAYFVPSWDPIWIRFIPTYPLIQGFKECIIVNGDINYVLSISAGFLIVGLLLFIVSNLRYKKTLTV